jgi:type II secretory pathway pseudopilin PulG
MAFSLVELLAVMVSGAVLAITAGTLLFFGFLGWRRHSQALDMQRDATLAMKVVGDAVRESHAASLQRLDSGSRLNIPLPGVTSSVYKASNDPTLRFRPNVNRASDEYVLMAGKVMAFDPVLTNGGAVLTVTLRERPDDGTVQYVGRFKCRN